MRTMVGQPLSQCLSVSSADALHSGTITGEVWSLTLTLSLRLAPTLTLTLTLTLTITITLRSGTITGEVVRLR